MRFTGTSIWRESSAAVMPSSRNSSARCSPGWMGRARHLGFPSMIIDDLYVHRAGRSFRPSKTDPPLIVDADRKLSGPVAVAFEGFQSIARQCRQVGKASRCLESVETHLSLPCKARELLDVPSGGKPLGGFVPIADNHGGGRITGFMSSVNSKSTPLGPKSGGSSRRNQYKFSTGSAILGQTRQETREHRGWCQQNRSWRFSRSCS